MTTKNEKPGSRASAPAVEIYAWLLSLCVGLAMGVGIGAALGRIGAGVGIGTGLGVAVGLFLVRRIRSGSNSS